ncbi:hypothetical protein H4R34_003116 [Dimargaris verticillata]|uniref:Ankyrin repeat-containing domain protein n=1 Tax=Dimargaris verticillata TaxID=2761393 RepID=A0A9W8B856_9FUNG|nr:hypothetical protein H4R34_003116 [Dimargaris verticillata]
MVLHEATDDPGCLEYLVGLEKRCGIRVDVNYPKRGGWTALHTAASKGNTVVIALLLHAGACATATTKDGHTPVHLASEHHHTAVVIQLVSAAPRTALQPTNNGRLPIHIAARQGDLATVRWFLQQSVDAAEHGFGEPGNQPNDATIALSTLAKPATWSVAELVRAEDKAGTDVLKDGIVSGSLSLLQYLVGTTAKRSTLSAQLHRQETSTGKLPIHVAALTGNVAILQYLHQNGIIDEADGNAKDTWDEWTPLCYAARYGHLAAIEYLIHQCHADKHIADRHQRTPCDIAKLWRQPDDIVHALAP